MLHAVSCAYHFCFCFAGGWTNWDYLDTDKWMGATLEYLEDWKVYRTENRRNGRIVHHNREEAAQNVSRTEGLKLFEILRIRWDLISCAHARDATSLEKFLYRILQENRGRLLLTWTVWLYIGRWNWSLYAHCGIVANRRRTGKFWKSAVTKSTSSVELFRWLLISTTRQWDHVTGNKFRSVFRGLFQVHVK